MQEAYLCAWLCVVGKFFAATGVDRFTVSAMIDLPPTNVRLS
jgi:hypothetical protein